MAASYGRPPSPDGQKRQVEILPIFSHFGEDIGVAGEIYRRLSLYQITHAAGGGTEWIATAGMVGVSGGDFERSDPSGIGNPDLFYVFKSLSVQHIRRARGGNQLYPPVQHSQGGQVEMVEMQVGYENGVYIFAARRVDLVAPAPDTPDSVSQDGIGHEPDAVHLDEDGSMADVSQIR